MEYVSFRPFQSTQEVHFDMLDLLGMLHNSAYLLLFERARSEYWKALKIVFGEDGSDWPFFVVHNEIDYHSPIYTALQVNVQIQLVTIGRTSLSFEQKVYLPDGSLSASGKTVLVRVDFETKRPIPWSELFRQRINPHLAA